MKSQSLNGQWSFRKANSPDWKAATVPGSVQLDLMEQGLMPDPFIGANEDDVQWVIEEEWEYQRSFTVTEEFLQEEKIILQFSGIDTIADVYLNDVHLGRTENMFRVYEFEVKEILGKQVNILRIHFPSLKAFIDTEFQKKQIPDTSPMGIEGGQYVRKAPSQFGWDWGPALPPIGIWKEVNLFGFNHPRLEEIHLRQIHNQTIHITAQILLDVNPVEETHIEMVITDPDGGKTVTQHLAQKDNKIDTAIDNPRLWYPNGYGSQPLYSVNINLKQGNAILESRQYRIGLRTIELRQEEDEWGKSFTFVVNDIPIFAKGANWVPGDSLPTRLNRKRLEQWMQDTVAANQNMLRVWGGGFYESEDFYDLCDEYGILVWQDFIFACKIYPLDDKEYLENFHQEVIQNAARLRHRTSLALWCGNNEMEWGWEEWSWDRPESAHLKTAYDVLFHYLLPKWLEDLDPDTEYWPSSPSSNQPFTNVNGQKTGDSHYWDVWHGGKPFTAYRDQFPRFMSEFGFQAFPTLETIHQYTEQPDRNLTSYVMELHQKNNNGNRLIINQMTAAFRIPTSFDKLMYASHILQAEGIRYGVEHWRRHKNRVSGILYWQLNDCWPVASWASIDYYGRWKALHYAAKKFYAPLLLSVFDQDQKFEIWLTSDALEDFAGTIQWKLMTVTGEIKKSGEQAVKIQAQHSEEVMELEFALSPEEKFNTLFVAELWDEQQLVTTQTVTFHPDKHINYVDPQLETSITVKEQNAEIQISAKNFARFVEVKLEGIDTIFSDNYFDIPAGETRSITCAIPDGSSAQSLKKQIRLMHLHESYQE